jgi:aspartate racemase
MKIIGLIGGLGPESTLDYYRLIIRAFQERKSVDYPEIVVYSANLTEGLKLMEGKNWGTLTDWLLYRIEALRRAGAEFAAIGSNSPHVVFDAVQRRSALPLVSIVEATCRKARELGVKRLGLLGTAFTMQADFFQKPFLDRGMDVVVPEPEDQQLIHRRLFTEIELGIITDSTRQELLSVVRGLIDRHGIEALILGCTELPLILTKDEFGIPFLNTTAIHADAIVLHALGLTS